MLADAGLFREDYASCFSQVQFAWRHACLLVECLPLRRLICACALVPCSLPQGSLNAFMAKGRDAWRDARARIQDLLSADVATLRDNDALRAAAVLPAALVRSRTRA